VKRALLRKLDEAREAELGLRGDIRTHVADEATRTALIARSTNVMRALDELREMLSKMREE
jgi:hypothetical protein